LKKSIQKFSYPDLGVITTDPVLPKVDNISGAYSFIGRIFGMQKDRAIIPHGHKNMTSCHRVLQGEFLLKQYDRLRDEGDFIFIKKTIEESVRWVVFRLYQMIKIIYIGWSLTPSELTHLM
jgi:hypothetical protein